MQGKDFTEYSGNLEFLQEPRSDAETRERYQSESVIIDPTNGDVERVGNLGGLLRTDNPVIVNIRQPKTYDECIKQWQAHQTSLAEFDNSINEMFDSSQAGISSEYDELEETMILNEGICFAMDVYGLQNSSTVRNNLNSSELEDSINIDVSNKNDFLDAAITVAIHEKGLCPQ